MAVCPQLWRLATYERWLDGTVATSWRHSGSWVPINSSAGARLAVIASGHMLVECDNMIHVRRSAPSCSLLPSGAGSVR